MSPSRFTLLYAMQPWDLKLMDSVSGFLAVWFWLNLANGEPQQI